MYLSGGISLTTIDIIILIIIGIGAINGFRKGFLRQLASILGLIAGLVIAKALFVQVAEKIYPSLFNSISIAQIVAFLVIWAVVPLCFLAVASVLTKAARAVCLGGFNSLLGGLLGALKYLLLVILVIGVLEFIDRGNKLINTGTKEESVFYYPLKSVIGQFLPLAKDITKQYIEDTNNAWGETL